MKELSEGEKKLLDLIRRNPFAAQSDLAATLGIARPTVAAQITDLINRGFIAGRGYILSTQDTVVCIGGAAINRKYHSKNAIIKATSNPGSSHCNFGGVARNVAENLAKLKASVKLLSLLGDDEAGHAILAHMRGVGVDVSQTVVSHNHTTAEYVAILDDRNELHVAVAAMDAFDNITAQVIDSAWSHIALSRWVFMDCNLPAETIDSLLRRKNSAHFKVALDTVSVPKASRLPDDLSAVDLMFTNIDEAKAVLNLDVNEGEISAEELSHKLKKRGVKSVVITQGAQGHIVNSDNGMFHTSCIETAPTDITGAGDALISGTLNGLMNGLSIEEATRLGVLLATLSIESETDVLDDLSPELLETQSFRMKQIKTKRVS